MPIDPLTAALNLLCTPGGQRLLDVADSVFQQIVKDIIVLVHKKHVEGQL